MKVAIPHFGDSVAPCFEYTAAITIFRIEDGKVADQTDFSLQSQRAFDRVRLLRDQGVDTLICGGVQGRFEDLIRANGIQTISWVYGTVEDLLDLFVRGELRAGQGRSEKHEQPAEQNEESEKA
ncbi:MAG: NifB/NifX family molybdenum-iron cluster-binding protein [Pseudomonadota bacterium]